MPFLRLSSIDRAALRFHGNVLRLTAVVVALCLGSFAAEHNSISIESLIRQSKLAEADKQIQAELLKNPSDGRALNLLGVVRRKQAKYGMAEQAFHAAIEANPKSAEALENLGSLYADEGRIAEAIPLYEKAQALTPHSPKVVTQLAWLYTQNGEFERSLKTAESIAVASRPDKLLPIMIADYIGLKRMDDVQKGVPEILRRAPSDPELVPQLANVFLQGDMVGDAEELLNLAKTRLKPTASLLTAEANAQARSGKSQQAMTTIKEALALDPNYADALWGAARLAGSAGDWKQAVIYLKQMLKVTPPRSEVLQNLVFASMQIDDLQTAHDAALDLQDLDPESLDSELVLSAVLIRASHWGEAEPLLRKALTQHPDDKRVQLAMGIIDYNLGHLDEAEQLLKKSLGEKAGDPEAHYMLGLIAKQRGDMPAAAEQMESSVQLDPQKAEALASLGELYLQLNEIEKARSILERAIKVSPANAQNHYQLAITYRRLGLTAEAQDQMKLFQQLSARHVAQPTGESAHAPR